MNDPDLRTLNLHITPEWQPAYPSYKTLLPHLPYLQYLYKHYHHQTFSANHQTPHYDPLPPTEVPHLQHIHQHFLMVLEVAEQKIQLFYTYQQAEIIMLCSRLESIVRELEKSQIVTHSHCVKRHWVKEIVRVLYVRCELLLGFVKGYDKICGQVKDVMSKYIVPFLQKSSNIMIIECPPTNFCPKTLPSLNTLSNNIKNFYSQLVYLNNQKQHQLEHIAHGPVNQPPSPLSYCLIGLFVGIGVITILTILLLFGFGFVKLNYEDSVDSMNFVFPIFRGIGLFILYLWGMAWNVYGFTKNGVNFPLVLEYGQHYSTSLAIIKRVTFFTLVFFLMLLIYFIGLSHNIQYPEDNRLPVEYAPFVVWVLYFGYIFFPNRDVFNSKGRKYFYRMLKEVIMAPFTRMSFVISWITDQSVSFIIPIKDLSYSLCYYTSTLSDTDSVGQCSKSYLGFFDVYFIALIPLLLRMGQCYRQAVQDKGKFFGHLQMWNFGKYSASVITATLGYLSTSTNDPQIKTGFIVSSIFSTLYAYFWDLKYDWGLLESNSKYRLLRSRLCYKIPHLYYAAILGNLIFRLSWTLTLSSFLEFQAKTALMPLLTGLIQIFRRSMWNFFRIQKEHLANCTRFAATKNIDKQLSALETDTKKQLIIKSDTIVPYFKKSTKLFTGELVPEGYQVSSKNEIQQYLLQFEKVFKEEEFSLKKYQ